MAEEKKKLKFAFYWAASCGGCEIAVLDIDEKILDVVQIADIVFWPVAMDIKYKDVENMPMASTETMVSMNSASVIDACAFSSRVISRPPPLTALVSQQDRWQLPYPDKPRAAYSP